MAYIDQFISALHFYFDLNPLEVARPDFYRLRQHFMQSQSPGFASSIEKTKVFAAWLADRFVDGYSGELAHSCHAASAGFLKSWEASRPAGLPGTLAVTVGSVWFKGRPLFETTRAAIAELVHTGKASATNLPVHVWLTMDDLTVVDLTVISTLIKYGELPVCTPPVLFWQDGCSSDFTFEPILVDNLFFERVDSGIFTVQVRS